MMMSNQLSSTSQTDDSYVFEIYTTDDMTTDEMLVAIEYNTRMAAQGISHIFSIMLVLLCFFAVWAVFKKWFFGGV